MNADARAQYEYADSVGSCASNNGRLSVRWSSSAKRLWSRFTTTWHKKKFRNLCIERISKTLKHGYCGIFQPPLKPAHVSAVNIGVHRENFL
jgi:hypothetical protein